MGTTSIDPRFAKPASDASTGTYEPKKAVSLLRNAFKTKLRESLSAVLPITAIVLILSFTVAPMPIGTLLLFILGAMLLIAGTGLFTLGADVAMMPIGRAIGRKLSSSNKTFLIAGVCLAIGMAVTIAEPDLQVLARQVPAVPNMTLILTVAAGVGVFLVVAFFRMKFGIPLRYFIVGLYGLVFLLACFVPGEFLAVAFDSGGVTTGPITVPFIIAMGAGLAALSGKDEDAFGVVAICSVGPILAVMVLGLLFDTSDLAYVPFAIPEIETSQQAFELFMADLPIYLEEVAIGLLPVMAIFAVAQVASLRLGKCELLGILRGVLITYAGLVLFLLGANVGFMPAGHYLGEVLAAETPWWTLMAVGAVVGFFIVAAEPAVHVLNKQVEDVTDGAVGHMQMGTCLAVGVALASGLAMLRVCFHIPVMAVLVPGYLAAALLSFKTPSVFTSIAFDSGGVASGPMTATFLLPFAMGACTALGGNVLTDAFGVVALVAMTPLVTVQVMGLVSQRKTRKGLHPRPADAMEDAGPSYTSCIYQR